MRRMVDFLGLFIRKIFQILLSFLVAFFFVIYLLEIYSCIDPTFWCTFKNEAQNCVFNSIYSLIMIFVLGFWGHSLYKSYKNPFTWKSAKLIKKELNIALKLFLNQQMT